MTTKRLATLCLAWALVLAPAAMAQTLEEDIEASIVAGLDWLATQQLADGSWSSGCDSTAATALVLLKFEDRALDLGYDPLDPAYAYAPVVAAALDYVGLQATSVLLGDPDGNGNGLAVYFGGCSGHEVYTTGIVMMALSASQHPEIYGDMVQDTVDWMSWAQADDSCGWARGGWRYWPNTCQSDNSISGYATLGLGFARAAAPYGFGVSAPQWVDDELDYWIDYIQNDVDGDLNDGGSGYADPTSWVNILKTGNLIYEMGLVGDDAATQRVVDAVDYLERHWYDPGVCGTGWMDHRQAMFTMMKGLEALGIDYLDLDGSGVADDEWFPLVAQHLVDTQQLSGAWPYDCWGNEVLSTAWALLTLEKAVPTFEIQVAVDVHPTSCPNPLNVGRKGVVPVAVLGTGEFDVTQIDPATVTLEGVAPLRWAVEDVATPYEPFVGKLDAMDCNELGPDGYVDMTFKFNAQELVAALGPVNDGDVVVAALTGNLLEAFGGTPIVGEDVILILKK